jgi:hypothetical protein
MVNTAMNKDEALEKLSLPIRFGLRFVGGIRKAQEFASDFEVIRQGIIKEYDIKQITDSMKGKERAIAVAHNEEVLPEANAKIIEALKQEIEIDFEPIELDKFKEEELDKLNNVLTQILDYTYWMWKGQ